MVKVIERGVRDCPDCGTRLSSVSGDDLCPHCLLALALEASSEQPVVADETEAATLELEGASLEPGQVLGNRYRIRSLLGRGGMGEVWRAHDLKLRVDVALKALHPGLLASKRALETLRQEVRVAREVVSPNLCRVYDLVEIEGRELVSMEYVDGTTLAEVLRARGPLELEEARGIAAQFLAGLEAIHEARLVHRDVKPENVMLTRAGRVVVMDFGIAKGRAEARTGTVSGTPAYMAPEQARGDAVDARADVFSAGVVLAEMVAPEGVATAAARQAVWEGAHREPPRLADTPWAPVLKRAVARRVEQRYASAAALARALEEVTLRVAGAEDLRPYPGLASFTADDAEYFFGREYEIEAMWKRLRRAHLLGLIGPSGAGKSSFLRAGLLPAMPAGWTAVVSKPGSRPIPALARALAPELAGDAVAVEDLTSFDEPDVAISLMSRWRRGHEQALVVVDQFEELFTLNRGDVQQAFADLLGRLALEADVRVLLAMRDDFLFRCHPHEALAPLFSELTPLGPPTGAALRRAVVQPALKCGYRFEDEALVDDMLAEVEGERGALPLLAFAAARLWEERDREQGLLARAAYEQIGGVAGALAQHAEATLEKIGSERVPVARELFRNLVTSQGTRASRDRQELLSVFEGKSERGDAAVVLDALVDARLLTSYEAPEEEADRQEEGRRIEIVHESLLASWPRLVRWQTQDTEGAQLRDELRQAAQLWDQHSRSEDYLWTGTAFREFQLWRERYPGGLSEQETAFGNAMTRHAERRRRRRRVALAAVIVVLLAISGTIGTLWRRSEQARRDAVLEAQHREAAQLVSLGRLELEDYPTAALAYALASLERRDTPEARRFAVEALARGAAAFVLPAKAEHRGLALSRNGRWLAIGSLDGGVTLWPRDGGDPVPIVGAENALYWLEFDTGGDLLSVESRTEDGGGTYLTRVFRVPEAEEVYRSDLESSPSWPLLRDARLFTFPGTDGERAVRSTPVGGGEAASLGLWEFQGHRWILDVSPDGRWLAFARDRSVYRLPLDDLGAEPRRLGQHGSEVVWVRFQKSSRRIASADDSGEVCVWQLEASGPTTVRKVQSGLELAMVRMDASGSTLVVGQEGPHTTMNVASVWDLDGPPDAEPLVLRHGDMSVLHWTAVEDKGQWLATAHEEFVALWPIDHARSRVLREPGALFIQLAFTPDGEWLVSSSADGAVRLWPRSPLVAEGRRILIPEVEGWESTEIALDPIGGNVLTTHSYQGRVTLSPFDGGRSQSLPRLSSETWPVSPSISRDGRFAAAGTRSGVRGGSIEIWDLQSGGVRGLDPRLDEARCGLEKGFRSLVWDVEFTADGNLLTADVTGLRLWDLGKGESTILRSCLEGSPSDGWPYFLAAASATDRYLLLQQDLAKKRYSTLSFFDLGTGASHEIEGHGDYFRAAALDPAGEIVVSGDLDGLVRVGPVTGEEPHLLYGHRLAVIGVAVSPDGEWIASGSQDGTIRLWPMPDLDRPPLHTLPRNELIAKLESITNLRVVADRQSETGYSVVSAPFPGWQEVPTW